MHYRQTARWLASIGLAAALAAGLGIAQTQGGGGGGGGTGGGGGGTTDRGGTAPPTQPRTPTTPGQQPQTPFPGQTQQPQTQRFPEMRRPIYLQGKVVFEDGTPAPPNVLIERVCAGRPIPEGYTDSKGRFSFEVGRNAHLIPDASVGSYGTPPGLSPSQWGGGPFGGPDTGVSERDLAGCELRARLAGYRSTSIELTGRRMFDNPNVGTLVLHKIGNVSGYTISMSSLQAPKKAKKAFKKGVKEAGKKKWDKARREFEKAVAVYPEYAEAWYALGQIYQAQQQVDKAREAYRKSIDADEKYMNPYVKLALLDAMNNDWEKVAELTGLVLKRNPYDFPEAYFLNSMAHLNLKNNAEAEKAAREAIKMEYWKQRPQLEQILGLALAFQNQYEEAAVHLRRYLELTPNARNAPIVREQLSRLEQFLAQQKPSDVPKQAVAAEPSPPGSR